MTPRMTRFAGVRFKSLLEARWAVFFNTLGLRWVYEHRRFDLGFYSMRTQQRDAKIRSQSYGLPNIHYGGDNLIYTPDFILPELELFVEVKPSELTQTERVKIGRLSFRASADFLVLIGLDQFYRVPWYDTDYYEKLENLNFMSPSDPEKVDLALRAARRFGGSDDFSDFDGEVF